MGAIILKGGAIVTGALALLQPVRAGTPVAVPLTVLPNTLTQSPIDLNLPAHWSIRRRGYVGTVASSQSSTSNWALTVNNSQNPTIATVTPPVGAVVDIYLLTYYIVGKNSYQGDFRLVAANAPDGTLQPLAPTISNITDDTVDYAGPSSLLARYEYYTPQVYDPVVYLWQTAGPNIYGGGSGQAAKLRFATGGYKMRFLGVPPADGGGSTVEGVETAPFSTLNESPPVACSSYPDGKNISIAYKDHLGSSSLSRALLFKVERKDGVVFGYTTHDVDINGSSILRDGVVVPETNGVLFVARAGMSPTGVEHKTGAEADNMDVQVVFEDDRISVDDIRAGAYDDAKVFILECNWKDLTQGVMKHKKGWIGRISWDFQKFDASLRGLSDKLGAQIIEESSITCRAAQLGDERCQFNVDGNTANGLPAKVTGEITEVDLAKPRKRFRATALIPYDDNDFSFGRVLITEGGSENEGVEHKVRKSENGWIEISDKLPYPLVVGESFIATVGCDRRVESCFSRFSNVLHFVGECHMPGPTIYDRG